MLWRIGEPLQWIQTLTKLAKEYWYYQQFLWLMFAVLHFSLKCEKRCLWWNEKHCFPPCSWSLHCKLPHCICIYSFFSFRFLTILYTYVFILQVCIFMLLLQQFHGKSILSELEVELCNTYKKDIKSKGHISVFGAFILGINYFTSDFYSEWTATEALSALTFNSLICW